MRNRLRTTFIFIFLVLLLMCTVAYALQSTELGEIVEERFFSYFNDDKLDDNEIDELDSMSCDDLKEKLGLDRDACMYMTDDQGNMEILAGCPGISINGEPCMENE